MSGFFDLNNGKENWISIGIDSLKKQMREVFNLYKSNKKEYKKLQENGLKRSQEYSYEKIGNLIKEILDA